MITCGRVAVPKCGTAEQAEKRFRARARKLGHIVVRVICCAPIGDHTFLVTANVNLNEAVNVDMA